MLHKLVQKIEANQMMRASTFEGLNIDGYLDHLMNPEVSLQWDKVQQTLDAYQGELLDNGIVCKAAFMKVYELTGHGELAGLISDEFGLIADALSANLDDDPWLNGAVEDYLEGRLPQLGKVRAPGSLKAMLELIDD